MIKALTDGGLVILGLDKENVTRLQDGKPILLNLEDLGLDSRDVVIMYGETNEDMQIELGQHFTKPPYGT